MKKRVLETRSKTAGREQFWANAVCFVNGQSLTVNIRHILSSITVQQIGAGSRTNAPALVKIQDKKD